MTNSISTARTPTETNIRTLAREIYNRVNWSWMAPDYRTNAVRMGWLPDTGFSGFW